MTATNLPPAPLSPRHRACAYGPLPGTALFLFNHRKKCSGVLRLPFSHLILVPSTEVPTSERAVQKCSSVEFQWSLGQDDTGLGSALGRESCPGLHPVHQRLVQTQAVISQTSTCNQHFSHLWPAQQGPTATASEVEGHHFSDRFQTADLKTRTLMNITLWFFSW